MRKCAWILFCTIIPALLITCQNEEVGMDDISLDGFMALFDGQTLHGWQKLADGRGVGGLWGVEEALIVGEQTPEGEGGLLMTEKRYKDFEVYAEVKADYPIDSGIFLRIQPNILSYQVTIDYRPDGEVGAIYCPGGGGFLVHKPEGKELWKADEFNAVRARIQGQPPHIQAWINGTKVVDFQDALLDGKARVPEDGFVGIQVHPGGSWGKGNKVYCRKFVIKELNQ